VNDYYEAVFAEMVADGSLSFEPVLFDDGRWYEVDTLADLREAERLFSDDFRPPTSQLAEKHG
jgi:NDP-sugar pyrophosphorylase family protein